MRWVSAVRNLVYAVGIGLLIACIFFMKKSGDSMSELSLVRFASKEKLNENDSNIINWTSYNYDKSRNELIVVFDVNLFQ